MAILHIKAGPLALSLTRKLSYEVGSAKLTSSGDAQNTNFRGRPYVRGTVEIEDEADAIAILTAAAADVVLSIQGAAGLKNFTISGFQAFSCKADIDDGQKDGPVVGHMIAFEGNLETLDTAGTALVIADPA